MSRQRSARSAALGLTVRRIPTTIPSRGAGPLRRRLVVGVLVLALARAHLALVPLGRQRAAERRAVGGRDGAAPVRGRPRARRAAVPRRLRLGRQPADCPLRRRGAARGGARTPSARDPERVRAPGERVPARAARTTSTARAFRPTSIPVAAEVIGRPAGAFTQAIVIAAGSDDGVRSTIRSSPPTASSASSRG